MNSFSLRSQSSDWVAYFKPIDCILALRSSQDHIPQPELTYLVYSDEAAVAPLLF